MMSGGPSGEESGPSPALSAAWGRLGGGRRATAIVWMTPTVEFPTTGPATTTITLLGFGRPALSEQH